MTQTNSFIYFEGVYVCADFGENRSRNATVRVHTDGQIYTETQTDAQKQTGFIICPCAIAVGQTITGVVPFCGSSTRQECRSAGDFYTCRTRMDASLSGERVCKGRTGGDASVAERSTPPVAVSCTAARLLRSVLFQCSPTESRLAAPSSRSAARARLFVTAKRRSRTRSGTTTTVKAAARRRRSAAAGHRRLSTPRTKSPQDLHV